MHHPSSKRNIRAGLGAVLFLLLSPLGFAQCNEPAFTADIPDGKTASKEEMAKVQTAVNEYISAAESYIACIEDSQGSSRAQRINNSMLDAMQDVAAKFNRQLRYFRRANS